MIRGIVKNENALSFEHCVHGLGVGQDVQGLAVGHGVGAGQDVQGLDVGHGVGAGQDVQGLAVGHGVGAGQDVQGLAVGHGVGIGQDVQGLAVEHGVGIGQDVQGLDVGHGVGAGQDVQGLDVGHCVSIGHCIKSIEKTGHESNVGLCVKIQFSESRGGFWFINLHKKGTFLFLYLTKNPTKTPSNKKIIKKVISIFSFLPIFFLYTHFKNFGDKIVHLKHPPFHKQDNYKKSILPQGLENLVKYHTQI
jgi:hypothetical protein